MRSFARIISGLCCSALMLGAATAAHADSYGALTFTVWSGTYNSGLTDVANNANTPSNSLSHVTFTYTGPINFVNNNGQNPSSDNTFLDFFNSNGTTNDENFISGLTPTQLATLNSTILSSAGESGNSIVSYFEITGTLSGNSLLSLSSDDGACLYLNNVADSALCHSAPQEDTTYTDSPNAGAGTPFRLDYVEANGAPSDLTLAGASYATPEPGSIFMVGTGLLGLAGMVRRRLVA